MYRNELRKLGWKADIYVDKGYPEKLLYSHQGILRPPDLSKFSILGKYLDFMFTVFFFLTLVVRYRYHFYYGGVDRFYFRENEFGLTKLFGKSFRLNLWFSKLLGCKIIQVPSGCLEIETKANFSKFDGGNACNACGWGPEVCNDKKNVARFDLVRRYADMIVGNSCFDSSQFNSTHFKYKVLNLSLWHPNLEIPEEHKLPESNNLRIVHSFVDTNRNHDGKNIKGTPFIIAAIERLKKEGYPVEFLCFKKISSRDMRFYQAQADIVVEQIIYGWWGSTGVETISLGKPVVCYLQPSWKDFFLKTYPEYDELPIVEANPSNIYDVLKTLVTNHKYRISMGHKSRRFAKQHFDVVKNAKDLERILLGI
jgi:hypothetical protein